MKIFLKYIFFSTVAPFIFLYDIISFKFLKKKLTSTSYNFFIMLFCLTGGFSNKILDFILARSKKNFQSSYSCLSNLNEENANDNLLKLGFYYQNNVIRTEDIIEIKNFIKDISGKYASDGYNSKEKEFFDLKNPKATRFIYSHNDLIECKNIQKILIDKNLYKIVSNYFQKEPIIDSVTAWWSVPSEKADSNAAQLWHFDLERTKWLKIFIYLTDCTEINGPHYFIQKSHKDGGIPFEIRKNGYERVSQELIDKFYEKEDIKCFTSGKGGMLIEDTRGLHKGLKVKEGSRLMLQLQYTTNLLGKNDSKILFPKNYDFEFKKYRNENKFFFSNFVN
jgi:hypothetical protein